MKGKGYKTHKGNNNNNNTKFWLATHTQRGNELSELYYCSHYHVQLFSYFPKE